MFAGHNLAFLVERFFIDGDRITIPEEEQSQVKLEDIRRCPLERNGPVLLKPL